MKRHHRGTTQEVGDDTSSSSDEDAFSALSMKKRKKSSKGKNEDIKINNKINNKSSKDKGHQKSVKNDDVLTTKQAESSSPFREAQTENEDNNNSRQSNIRNNPAVVSTNANASNMSSKKRHHHKSSARAAKMDTLLQELEQTSKSAAASSTPSSSMRDNRPPPDKKGSFVSIEEEPFTTNIFVGNLSPLTTEEQLTEIFRLFGDLYSVKIMWPRTPEEHARGRNTGFVCFMNREDAKEAMDAYQERDPLRTGRRMMLRWGKNVKKSVKRGTGGVPIPPIRKKVNREEVFSNHDDGINGHDDPNNQQHIQASGSSCEGNDGLNYDNQKYDKSKHFESAIKVIAPKSQKRLDFIATVASFVAKDGSILEQRLFEREKTNTLFSFLHENCENKQERIFYRWRVFAFTQGDSFDSWKTDPFIMIQPSGRFWIPPPLDPKKAMREKIERELKEDQIRIKQERRRQVAEKMDFMTGRQLESMKRNRRDGGMIRLHPKDLEYWNFMIDKKLCASRDSICEVMAFCFDKSGAAQHISELLKGILMDNRKGVSIETKIARLYLMSDILYNSQQPGVRNAFKYRDAIEKMALDVFGCLGSHGNGSVGRITMNKLRNAVMAVLHAWAKWSVYNSTFLNQLESAFDGKPIEDERNEVDDSKADDTKDDTADFDRNVNVEVESNAGKEEILSIGKPISTWVDKSESEEKPESILMNDDIDGEDLDEEDIAYGFVEFDANLDGESLHDSDLDEENETRSNTESQP